jgi:hypothetical protein
MTATKNDQRTPTPESDGGEVTAAITAHVLDALGRPDDGHRVVVRRLWADHYRVNVLVGTDVTATTIAHSYFLVTDADGKVRRAAPAIARRYRALAPPEDQP